jgi:site-specific DNA recombinase
LPGVDTAARACSCEPGSRYYTCTRQARYGKTACKGESIRLDQLDRDATNLLVTDLCRAEWIRNCISRWMAASDLEGRARGNRLKNLQQEIESTEAALGRLYAAIEAGTINTDDPILRERVAGLKLKRDEAASFVRLLGSRDGSEGLVDLAKIDRFVHMAPTILRSDTDPRRRALVQLLVRKAVLAEGNLVLTGDPADLAKAVAACRGSGTYVVPSFVREWLSRKWKRFPPKIENLVKSVSYSDL